MKYMTPPATTFLKIIVCGVQSALQAIVACALRPIGEIFYMEVQWPASRSFPESVSGGRVIDTRRTTVQNRRHAGLRPVGDPDVLSRAKVRRIGQEIST